MQSTKSDVEQLNPFFTLSESIYIRLKIFLIINIIDF